MTILSAILAARRRLTQPQRISSTPTNLRTPHDNSSGIKVDLVHRSSGFATKSNCSLKSRTLRPHQASGDHDARHLSISVTMQRSSRLSVSFRPKSLWRSASRASFCGRWKQGRKSKHLDALRAVVRFPKSGRRPTLAGRAWPAAAGADAREGCFRPETLCGLFLALGDVVRQTAKSILADIGWFCRAIGHLDGARARTRGIHRQKGASLFSLAALLLE